MATPRNSPDAGLAGQRTALAWNRSGLAIVVCIAVLLRHVVPLRGTDQELALGLISAAAIVWAIVLAVFTLSSRRREAHGDSVFRLMTAATLTLAAVGFVASFAV